MKLFAFTLKRAFTSPLFLCLMLASALLPVLFSRVSGQIQALPAAYVCEGTPDTDAARLCAYLKDSGFIQLESADTLYAAVARGSYDAGVVIPAGLSEKLSAGKYQGALTFIKAPTTMLGDLWQEHAASALFAVYAPYITEASFPEGTFTREEVFDAYWGMMEEGSLFRFELRTEKGALIPETDRRERFFTGALAILLYIAAFFGSAMPLMKTCRQMQPRLGWRRCLLTLLLPGLLLRMILLYLAAAAACLAAEMPTLLAPSALYLLLITLLHTAALFLPGRHWQPVAVMLLAAAAIALCPIYTDLTLLVPPLSVIRLFCPPYWLWLL